MANQSIALQARAPQSDPLGGAIRNNAQMINMMMQQQAAQRQNAIAEQTMQIQRAKEARETAMAAPQLEKAQSEAGAARLDLVTKAVGHALHTSVNNPTDETLDQAAATLAGIGLNPAEIEREIMPIKQLPLDQRKGALMQSILSDPNSKAAFEATLPKLVEVRRGDRIDQLDKNPLSSTFNQVVRSDMVGMTPAQAFRAGRVGQPNMAAPAAGGVPSGRGGGGGVPSGRGGGGGVPSGRGGGGAVAGGKPAGRTTEAERRFGTISQNMADNLNDLVTILQTDPSAIKPGGAEYLASGLPFVGDQARKFARSSGRRQFEASVQALLDNITYVNTGAGVTKKQEENYRTSYVPEYTDEPKDAKRKLERMIRFAKNTKAAAGALWTPDMDQKIAALEQAAAKLGIGGAAPASGGKSSSAPKRLKYNPSTGGFD